MKDTMIGVDLAKRVFQLHGTCDPAPKKWTGSGRHALHVGR